MKTIRIWNVHQHCGSSWPVICMRPRNIAIKRYNFIINNIYCYLSTGGAPWHKLKIGLTIKQQILQFEHPKTIFLRPFHWPKCIKKFQNLSNSTVNQFCVFFIFEEKTCFVCQNKMKGQKYFFEFHSWTLHLLVK